MERKGMMKFVEAIQRHAKDILGYVPEQFEMLSEHEPDVLVNFVKLHNAVLREGALSSKIKSLMSLAVATATGCEWCIKWHTKDALDAGATEAEMAETIGVALVMSGGPGLMRSEITARAYEEYSKILKKKGKERSEV